MKKTKNFLINWRPFPKYELISYALMYASVPMLAFGIQFYNIEIVKIILLTILTLYSGFFAALIWNDITDVDIDSISHPDRPVPTGIISKKNFFLIALIFSLMTFIFAYMVNFWCLILVGINALFVTFHDKFFKKKVKIPAYSEIFTPIQWIIVAIFGFLAIWTVVPQDISLTFYMPLFENISTNIKEFQNMIILVLFTYFADNAHDLPEGIHDLEGDRKLGVQTYATSFGVKKAAKISFYMFFISGILGFLLFYRTSLTLIFLIPFIFLWIYILYKSYKFMKKDEFEIKKNSKLIGRIGFNYFLLAYNLIFLDLFIQLIIYHI